MQKTKMMVLEMHDMPKAFDSDIGGESRESMWQIASTYWRLKIKVV